MVQMIQEFYIWNMNGLGYGNFMQQIEILEKY